MFPKILPKWHEYKTGEFVGLEYHLPFCHMSWDMLQYNISMLVWSKCWVYYPSMENIILALYVVQSGLLLEVYNRLNGTGSGCLHECSASPVVTNVGEGRLTEPPLLPLGGPWSSFPIHYPTANQGHILHLHLWRVFKVGALFQIFTPGHMEQRFLILIQQASS